MDCSLLTKLKQKHYYICIILFWDIKKFGLTAESTILTIRLRVSIYERKILKGHALPNA